MNRVRIIKNVCRVDLRPPTCFSTQNLQDFLADPCVVAARRGGGFHPTSSRLLMGKIDDEAAKSSSMMGFGGPPTLIFARSLGIAPRINKAGIECGPARCRVSYLPGATLQAREIGIGDISWTRGIGNPPLSREVLNGWQARIW